MKETKQEIRKQYLYFSESEQELEKAGVGVTMPDHQGGEPEVAVTTAGPPRRPGVGGIQMQEPGKTEPIRGPRRLPSKHTLAQRYTWKTVHCVLNPYILEIRKKVKITRSSLTLCNPMDYTVHGILQARILECITIPFSRGSSQPRD